MIPVWRVDEHVAAAFGAGRVRQDRFAGETVCSLRRTNRPSYGIFGALMLIGLGVAIEGVMPGKVIVTLSFASPEPVCVL